MPVSSRAGPQVRSSASSLQFWVPLSPTWLHSYPSGSKMATNSFGLIFYFLGNLSHHKGKQNLTELSLWFRMAWRDHMPFIMGRMTQTSTWPCQDPSRWSNRAGLLWPRGPRAFVSQGQSQCHWMPGWKNHQSPALPSPRARVMAAAPWQEGTRGYVFPFPNFL